jgi:UDP-glucose 4-epimerase
LLDTSRARRELDWSPRHSGVEAIRETVDGLLHDGAGRSPVLRPRSLGRETRKAARGDTIATRGEA